MIKIKEMYEKQGLTAYRKNNRNMRAKEVIGSSYNCYQQGGRGSSKGFMILSKL